MSKSLTEIMREKKNLQLNPRLSILRGTEAIDDGNPVLNTTPKRMNALISESSYIPEGVGVLESNGNEDFEREMPSSSETVFIIDDDDSGISHLQGSLSNIASIDSLSDKIPSADIPASFSLDRAQWNEERESLHREIRALQEQLRKNTEFNVIKGELEQELKAKTSEVASLSKQAGELKRINGDMSAQISDSSAEMTRLKMDVKSLRAEVESNAIEKKSLQEELLRLRKDHEQALQHFDHRLASCESERKQADDLVSRSFLSLHCLIISSCVDRIASCRGGREAAMASPAEHRDPHPRTDRKSSSGGQPGFAAASLSAGPARSRPGSAALEGGHAGERQRGPDRAKRVPSLHHCVFVRFHELVVIISRLLRGLPHAAASGSTQRVAGKQRRKGSRGLLGQG